ncbi:response regulator transcription factor [Sphingomonas sp.]|uniref:helix-turn-helix transcriptional regulator n=1 Tax=Sphingomonas sp. TaxID=28214 RepID=UPI001ED5DE0B|nr:response regulator transcription factor [Sphingomonas sp.]MBX3595113.1 response regulator transcription factor [Sphingomonas sp.]
MARRGWPDIRWWRQVFLCGVALAAGAGLLEWLDYRWIARTHSIDLYLLIVAVAFLAIGLFAGARMFGAPLRPRPPGNPAAQESLGISAREMAVLAELAAGYSNKEIARRLSVSPNTVKTHVARLFQKLDARRRTDAIARARALGLLR